MSNMAALILGGKPKGENHQDEPDTDSMLEQCMEDFHRSLKADSPSYKGMASAIRSAFEILESAPHDEEEGEEK